MQQKLREKTAIVGRLNEFFATEPMRCIINALDFLIQESRELNDHASKDEIGFNQGRISAFKDLKQWIEVGVIARKDLTDSRKSGI